MEQSNTQGTITVSHGDRFKQTTNELVKMVQDLVSEVSEKGFPIIDPTVIGVAAGVISLVAPEKLLEVFIRRSHQHWDKIRGKEKSFFVEEAHNIFSDLPGGHVTAFKELVTIVDKDQKPVVLNDDIDILFEYFHSMIRISIQHIHSGREPMTVKVPDGTMYKYNKPTFFQYVDVADHAKKWEIKLEF